MAERLAPRVILRAPALRAQAEFLEAARRSQKLHRHFAYPPLEPMGFRELVSRAMDPTRASRFVFDAGSGALVGVINLNEIVRASFQSAYLGYYAFEPYAAQGFMRSAMSLVLQLAFRELRLHRVEANIQPDNERSIALVRRLGFQQEGFSPRYLKLGGRWRDHERWALRREDWSRMRTTS